MSIIGIILAVMMGVWGYNIFRDSSKLFKIDREYKKIRGWIDQCKKNIAEGKDVEDSKRRLEVYENALNRLSKKMDRIND